MHKKRFIAGATCPSCGKLDTLFTYESEQKKWRACATCELNENTDSIARALDELPTRVNQPRLGEATLAHEVPVEPIKLLD